MARGLSKPFVDDALSPLGRVAALVDRHSVGDALASLDADALLRAVERGIGRTARRAGAPRARVARLVPERDVVLVARLIDSCRVEAADAWARQFERKAYDEASDPGARLRAATDRALDVAAIADVMAVLAAAMSRWTELVDACGRSIDASPELRRSRFWKWTRRGIAAAAATAAVTWFAWHQASLAATRASVEAVLVLDDPCTVERIPADAMAQALPEQQHRAAARSEDCSARRARAAREEAHRASCESVVAALERGRLEPHDEAFVGDKAPLFQRIAAGALGPRDLAMTPEQLEFGCPDTGTRVWAVAARAAARSAAAWAEADTVSAPLVQALSSGAAPLSSESERALGQHAEATAKRAALFGDKTTLDRAMTLCQLARDRGIEWRAWCSGVSILHARAHRGAANRD